MSLPHIKAVWFDMDGTLVTYDTLPHGWSTWSAIGWVGNIHREMEAWIEAFMRKEIRDEDIWANTAKSLKGISYAEARRILFPCQDQPPYNPNLLTCLDQLRPHFHLGIVSSGIELVAEEIQKELGFAFQLSNAVGVSHGVFDGTYRVGVPFYEKFKHLQAKADELGFALSEICFVGDSINDMECFEHVGLPVTYHPRYPEVTQAARGHVITDFAQLPEFIRTHSR